MFEQEMQYLLQRFLDDKITPEELARLRHLVTVEEEPALQEWLIGNTLAENRFEGVMPDDKETMFAATIREGARRRSRVQVRKIPVARWWAAAAIFAVLLAGAYFLLQPQRPVQPPLTAVNDVLPGSQKALLTLADGSVVSLDSSRNRSITQGITQYGGQLRYSQHGDAAHFNTLTTPRGGRFEVQLGDGTKVWLNAGSSLRYPAAFTGPQRMVEVTGEAYFEVAASKHRPFIVRIPDGMQVEVLGTHFNVNAYTDEPGIRTTLAEGSVRVTAAGKTALLRPGQQAGLSGGVLMVQEADLSRALAWKNGLFNFENASLEEVMRQMARWYDIEVVYEQKIPQIAFGGEMGMNLKLSDVLLILERSGVHFRLEAGKRLIVMP